MKEKSGITLIALVVTIVILLILSGVTINMLLGENGIIRTAQEAKNTWEDAITNEQEEIQNLVNELNNIMNEEGGSGGEEPEDPNKGPNGKPLVETATEIQTESNLEAEDEYGNPVTVPKGFGIVEEEGTTVPEGIVIQDKDGNQFVWIPVGRVYKDNTGTNYSDIQLGRYTFDEDNGTPEPVQYAYTQEELEKYKQEIQLRQSGDSYNCIEYATRENPDGITSVGLDGLNAVAKKLEGFVNSVKSNNGYYLARYEASYGSGNSVANYKPLSKVSKATDFSTSIVGSLWNNVTQIDAAKISRNMYNNDSSVGVESDLVNSYAWDTAIVFIQAMGNGNENYANKTSVNSSIANTGTTGDEVCNIHDMASNCWEWTTEYSTSTGSSLAHPCVCRGGSYSGSNRYTAYRGRNGATGKHSGYSFRLTLYVK